SSYDIQGTPAMIIDGVTKLSGADPSRYGDTARFTESCRDAYVSAVNARPQYVNIALSASLYRNGSDFSASSTFTTGPETPSSLAIRMVAFETSVEYDGRTYHNVVRAMMQPEEISSGGTSTFTKTFTTPSKTTDTSNIRVAAIVFDTNTGEIYQSAYSDQYPGAEGDTVQNPPPDSSHNPQSEQGFSLVNIMLIGTAIALGAAVLVRWRKV
ncbi:MAG: hypothetical protein QCI38_07400, partial [Candidatus Thermoplasmatota archaeon]|nr:hypothetical protein [Candidatus Thermoplasmatota archaeon]